MKTQEITTRIDRSSLVFTPQKLRELYLLGIPISSKEGDRMTEQTFLQKIENAQKTIETELNILLNKQIIQEEVDFNRNEFMQWGHIDLTFPVRKGFELEGWLNEVRQIQYPPNWIQEKDEIVKGYGVYRRIHIVPTTQGTDVNSAIYSGITPHLGFLGQMSIPNYWRVTYCTGFDEIPEDIADVIGKKAAIDILNILGDIVFGAGVSSQSLSLDGLSQSLATTQSASYSAYSARIKQYGLELKDDLKRLKSRYKGFVFTSL